MRSVERMRHWLMFAIGRGRVKVVDDSKGVQFAQVDLGPKGVEGSRGIRDNTPVLGLFGVASYPPVDSDVIVLFPGGDRSNGVAIAHGHQQYRLKDLRAGDAALYDVRGAYVWLTDQGLHVNAQNLPILIEGATTVTVKASGTMRFETPRLEVTGDIIDKCDTNGVTVKTLRDDYNAHKHPGVQAGGGVTGTTDHPAT